MRVAFIGDIVGRPGRNMIKEHLKKIRDEYNLDFVIANSENASAGFGLTAKNMEELFQAGIDVMTGGNHTWDKKEIIPFLDTHKILRPLNYPEGTAGKGVDIFDVGSEKLAIVNAMGYFTMPMVENPYNTTIKEIDKLKEQGISNIFVDFHAEATSEKRAIYHMLKDDISMLCGTHTHIGTDDLMIENGVGYVTDVGLTGCRDNIIGMDSKSPIKRFRTGLPASNEVPKNCKKILQVIIFELFEGKCVDAFKLKKFDNMEDIILKAFHER